MIPTIPERRRDGLVLLALWLMVLGSSSQVMIVAPILPRISEALGLGAAEGGALVSAYAISLSVSALLIGPISDRVGRRRVLMWGTGAMTVALVLHGFSESFASLLLARVAAGLAGGVLTGSAVSYVGDHFAYERRGWASGVVMSGFAVGQIAAVPLGTILAARAHFTAPFVAFAGITAVSFLLVVLVLPQPAVAQSRRRFTATAVVGEYAELLRSRAVRGAAFAYASMFFSVSAFVVFFPTWAERSLGIGPEGVALLFSVGGLAGVLFGPFAGRLSDRLGRKKLIVSSCAGSALLFAITPFVVREAAAAYVVFFAVMVLLAFRLSPLQALLTALVPDTSRGTLMSLVVATGQIGGGVGAAISGFTFDATGFVGCALLGALAIATTGLLVATQVPEPERALTPPTSRRATSPGAGAAPD